MVVEVNDEKEGEEEEAKEKWLPRKTSHHPPERRIHEKSSMEEICMRVEYKLAEYPPLYKYFI